MYKDNVLYVVKICFTYNIKEPKDGFIRLKHVAQNVYH